MAATGRTAAARPKATISGRVGGSVVGKDVRATVAGNTVTGRIGGRVVGWDVDLVLDARGYVDGRLGGRVSGKSITGQLTQTTFNGRIGGNVVGNTLHIHTEDSRLTGRIGGDVVGFDLNLQYDEGSRVVSGRIGGNVKGKTVRLQLTADADPILAALLAACAEYYLRVETARASNASGS